MFYYVSFSLMDLSPWSVLMCTVFHHCNSYCRPCRYAFSPNALYCRFSCIHLRISWYSFCAVICLGLQTHNDKLRLFAVRVRKVGLCRWSQYVQQLTDMFHQDRNCCACRCWRPNSTGLVSGKQGSRVGSLTESCCAAGINEG